MDTLSVFHCDPAPIMEFDDSDLADGSLGAVSLTSSNSSLLSKQNVPTIRQSVLITSLLEQLCSLYETDENKSKRLYLLICGQLSNLGIISPVAHLQEFASVHTQYRQTLYKIFQSSIMKLDVKPAFPENCDLSNMLNPESKKLDCKPVNVDPEKVFDFNTSRYRQEFIEKNKIGSGGYGRVFRTQSKIDGQEYAIKKILLRSSLVDESSSSLLREVRILAGLRHKNIVRYHGAWIEHTDVKSEADTQLSEAEAHPLLRQDVDNGFMLLSTDPDKFGFMDEPSNDLLRSDIRPFETYSGGEGDSILNAQSSKFWGNNTGSASESSDSATKNSKIHFSVSPQSSDDECVFHGPGSQTKTDASSGSKVKSKEAAASPPKEVILTHGVRRDMMNMHRVQSFIITKDGAFNNKILKTTRASSWSKLETSETESVRSNALAIPPKNLDQFADVLLAKTGLVLYIQMELCQTSLKHWLSVRNRKISQGQESFHEGTSLHILRQTVSALQFIHSKNLIHRDVKPPNIFLSNNNFYKPTVLLGDFGLAKKGSVAMDGSKPYNHRNPTLRRVDSHTSGVGTTTYAAPEQLTAEVYDAKVDMYSLGIVTYELWTVFGTAMERAKQIKQLRDHIIPSEFILHFPQVGRLINSLLDHDPRARPSSSEICQGDFFEKSKDKIIEEQTERIEALEKENRELKSVIKKLHLSLNSKRPLS